ncbi:MAG: XTP/dITP diphosphatase [FCB group bacterium]|nr:XTP/dITP diphosphatase [FCB group bacterium]
MRRQIVLATKNPGKLREIAQVLENLAVEVISLADVSLIEEPEETGATFAENARQKASYYARATGKWCLADDSGLVVDALAGRPGVYSARYAADRCEESADRETIDQANNDKLLEELADIPGQDRTARFVCHLALADSDGQAVLLESCGSIEGQIATSPAGSNGFGYDPLFFLPQRGCTTAELSAEQKNHISHRGQAVRQFAEKLKSLLE